MPKQIDAKSTLKAIKSERPVRDRAEEQIRSQLGLFHDARDIRDEREQGSMTELWMVAQSMMLCGLPYDEVADTQWERRARLADGSWLIVTFSATVKGVPLPFGQDRGPLYYLIDRAIAKRRKLLKQVTSTPSLSLSLPADVLSLSVEAQSRELELRKSEREKILDGARYVEWSTATEYLNLMGKAKGGKDYMLLKDRMRRIRACAISIVRERPNGDSESLVLPIIRGSRLPGWATASAERDSFSVSAKTEEPLGFEIGADFFKDFVQHHIPVPALIITKLLRRPKTLDLVMWLCWRVFAAKKDSFIPIDDLRSQLGSTDTNDGRLMGDIRKAIEFLHQAGWTQLRAKIVIDRRTRSGTTSKSGLQIGPPKDRVYFNLPGTADKLLKTEDSLDEFD